MLLVRDADLETTSVVAEKVRAAVEAMVVDLAPGRFGRLTASFGVASSAAHGTDRRVLIRTADRAFYEAKRNGRNQVAIAPRTSQQVDTRGRGAHGSGRHSDGAVRFYDRTVHEARRGVRRPSDPADEPIDRRKVFRADGEFSTSNWVDLVAKWFRASELVVEALAELAKPSISSESTER